MFLAPAAYRNFLATPQKAKLFFYPKRGGGLTRSNTSASKLNFHLSRGTKTTHFSQVLFLLVFAVFVRYKKRKAAGIFESVCYLRRLALFACEVKTKPSLIKRSLW